MEDILYEEGAMYYDSDFTSFEASFKRPIQEAVERQLYEYLTKDLPNHTEFMQLYDLAQLGKQTCSNKKFRATSKKTIRLSGEMCTSEGNGFSNLMINLYVNQKLGNSVVGVVEGDDGLFRVSKGGRMPTPADFAEFGFNIKLNLHTDLARASFCGQVFDPADKAVITDPREVLSSFGWSTGRYTRASTRKLKALLRAKAFSYGYQYQRCPIISSMARAYLRLTSGIDVQHLLDKGGFTNQYEKELLREAFSMDRDELNAPVGDATRQLMAELYGVSVEMQKQYEDYFDSLQQVEPIPDFGLVVTPSWRDYGERYVVKTNVDSLFLDIPPEIRIRSPVVFPIPVKLLSWGCDVSGSRCVAPSLKTRSA
jgi:hypothetical protein